MCLYPKLVNNPKYRVNKKNGGNVPPLKDGRVKFVPIGCGYCYECMKKKANEWKIRLAEDIKEHENGKFVTLTFSSEAFEELKEKVIKKAKKDVKGYALDNAIATLGVRLFLERVRKKTKKSLRHWLITELGGKGTENMHIHGIIYSDTWDIIDEKWQYGYIWPRKGSIHRKKNYSK